MFVYILLFLVVGYMALRFFLGISGNTSALDSRINKKLELYNSVKQKYPNYKKINIYKEVIKLSVGFEQRESEVIDSANQFRMFISPDTKINFQDVVYIMMEEEFHPKDEALATDIFAKVRERVDELIPKDL